MSENQENFGFTIATAASAAELSNIDTCTVAAGRLRVVGISLERTHRAIYTLPFIHILSSPTL